MEANFGVHGHHNGLAKIAGVGGLGFEAESVEESYGVARGFIAGSEASGPH